VILWIESPGGTVAGCYELAAAIRDLASKKVVVSYIEDFGTSAAYWYASQTQKVFANRPAIVGSIGVFGLLFDDEEFYARQGIRVIAIRSSELKGAGQPGVKVTAPQIEQERYRVMAYYGLFREAVQQGRRFNSRQLDEVSDGRIWIADDAAKVGLIDSVQTFEGCIESIGGLSASAFDELTAKHATRDAVEKRPVPRKVNFATNSTW
jgi:protease-4